MSGKMMELQSNGTRGVTRGWTRAAWVKRQTAKYARREVKRALRKDPENLTQKPAFRLCYGWVW